MLVERLHASLRIASDAERPGPAIPTLSMGTRAVLEGSQVRVRLVWTQTRPGEIQAQLMFFNAGFCFRLVPGRAAGGRRLTEFDPTAARVPDG